MLFFLTDKFAYDLICCQSPSLDACESVLKPLHGCLGLSGCLFCVLKFRVKIVDLLNLSVIFILPIVGFDSSLEGHDLSHCLVSIFIDFVDCLDHA